MAQIRKSIALILVLAVVTTTSAVAQPADCAESQNQGRATAESEHSATGWFFGGIGSGVLLGLIGTGVITGVAAGSNPTPDMYPDKDKVEVNCYLAGYKKVAKGKNTRSALFGGLLGTALFVTIYISAASP